MKNTSAHQTAAGRPEDSRAFISRMLCSHRHGSVRLLVSAKTNAAPPPPPRSPRTLHHAQPPPSGLCAFPAVRFPAHAPIFRPNAFSISRKSSCLISSAARRKNNHDKRAKSTSHCGPWVNNQSEKTTIQREQSLFFGGEQHLVNPVLERRKV